jgi:hypothetical protein
MHLRLAPLTTESTHFSSETVLVDQAETALQLSTALHWLVPGSKILGEEWEDQSWTSALLVDIWVRVPQLQLYWMK